MPRRRIDVHHHSIPPAYGGWLASGRFGFFATLPVLDVGVALEVLFPALAAKEIA